MARRLPRPFLPSPQNLSLATLSPRTQPAPATPPDDPWWAAVSPRPTFARPEPPTPIVTRGPGASLSTLPCLLHGPLPPTEQQRPSSEPEPGRRQNSWTLIWEARFANPFPPDFQDLPGSGQPLSPSAGSPRSFTTSAPSRLLPRGFPTPPPPPCRCPNNSAAPGALPRPHPLVSQGPSSGLAHPPWHLFRSHGVSPALLASCRRSSGCTFTELRRKLLEACGQVVCPVSPMPSLRGLLT